MTTEEQLQAYKALYAMGSWNYERIKDLLNDLLEGRRDLSSSEGWQERAEKAERDLAEMKRLRNEINFLAEQEFARAEEAESRVRSLESAFDGCRRQRDEAWARIKELETIDRIGVVVPPQEYLQLAEDKHRLDWLEEHKPQLYFTSNNDWACLVDNAGRATKTVGREKRVREAIDAAMRAEETTPNAS